MKKQKTNLADILRNAPKNIKLYYTPVGYVSFTGIGKDSEGNDEILLDDEFDIGPTGHWKGRPDGECLLFASEAHDPITTEFIQSLQPTKLEGIPVTEKDIPDGVYVWYHTEDGDILVNPKLLKGVSEITLSEIDSVAIVSGSYRIRLAGKNCGESKDDEAKFERAQELAASLGEGWRCPTRHEAIEIYDARFKGLDEALKIIGGDPIDEKLFWTCEADPDPQSTVTNAFFFGGGSGDVSGNYKSYAFRCRAAFAF